MSSTNAHSITDHFHSHSMQEVDQNNMTMIEAVGNGMENEVRYFYTAKVSFSLKSQWRCLSCSSF